MRRSRRASRGVPPAAVVLAACLAAPPLAAQCATAVFSTPDDADFGAAVALDEGLALVGDPTGGAASASAGAAWLLERGPWTWSAVAEFLPQPGTAGNARFGATVAVRGDLAAVGAPGEAGAAGAVYAYRREGGAWIALGRFLAPDAVPGAEFGASLALDGTRLAVGAPRDDQAGTDAGAVYLFELGPDGVQPAGKLLGAGALPGDGFGGSVAIEGGVLAAGTADAGLVWVFEEGGAGWSGAAVLGVPEAGRLGRSLALRDGRLLAGSPTTYATGIQSGAAHLFDRSGGTWALAATLDPPEPLLFAGFGDAVALDGGLAAIGAPGAQQTHGVVYVFHDAPTGWTLQAGFKGLAGPEYAALGGALALSGDVLVAGASAAFGPPGVAYVLGGIAPWEALGGDVGGAAGAPALTAHGTLCGGSPVALQVTGGPAAAPVLFVVGFSAAQTPFHGGTLWPAPDVLSLDVLGPDGSALLAGTWPIAQPAMLTVYAQAWIVDASASAGLAATPGLRAVTP